MVIFQTTDFNPILILIQKGEKFLSINVQTATGGEVYVLTNEIQPLPAAFDLPTTMSVTKNIAHTSLQLTGKQKLLTVLDNGGSPIATFTLIGNTQIV